MPRNYIRIKSSGIFENFPFLVMRLYAGWPINRDTKGVGKMLCLKIRLELRIVEFLKICILDHEIVYRVIYKS